MAEVAEVSSENESFREQLLDYLQKSEFTQLLADTAKKMEPLDWLSIASKVEDIDSARHLLGGCRRALESYPDHSGLLLLSAFSRIMIPKLPADTALGEFQRATRLLAASSEKIDTHKALIGFIEMIKKNRPPLVDSFSNIVLKEFPQLDMARTVLKHVETTSQSGMLALRILLNHTLIETKLVRAHILGGEPT